MRDGLRRFLLRSVLLTLLLPVALAVVGGLGGLLSAVGDRAGAVACGRVCLVVGAAWLMALAGTVTVGGLLALDGPPSHGPPPGRDRVEPPPAGH